MRKFKLKRTSKNELRVRGEWLDENGKKLFDTLELPDKNNANRVSCIPVGTYKCIRHVPNNKRLLNSKVRYVYWLQDVKGRSYIYTHIGNTALNILGCILIGMGKGTFRLPGPDNILRTYDGVTNSTDAMLKLLELGGKEFMLTIVE